MRFLRCFGFSSLLIIMTIGCGIDDKPKGVFKINNEFRAPYVTYDLDSSNVATVGNHSYVNISLDGTPAKYSSQILGLLDLFEKNHSELEITSWSIENNQSSYATSAYIYGIWINHRPR